MDDEEDTRGGEEHEGRSGRERERGSERRRGAAETSSGAAGGGGGGEENPYTVFILMDSLYDKLQLLDYDTDFCARRGFKPIPRHYFAVPENANEQLFYFGNLMSWMLGLAGQRFTAPDQYDDPNQVTTNIMLELRKQGLPTEFSQTKLKAGCGEEVCQVLNNLAQLALKAKKWQWKKPDHTRDENVEESAHVEDVEVVAERVVEEQDVQEDILDDDEEAAVIDSAPSASTAASTAHTTNNSSNHVMESGDAVQDEKQQQAWLAEVERVLPLLKVHLRTDVKDWRGHVEEMNSSIGDVSGSLTITKEQLDKLQAEVTRTLEKIGSREKYVNSQLDGLLQELRTQQDALAAVTARWNQSSTGVNSLARELAQLTEDLENTKNQMEERGSSMTDASPLVRIKQTLTKIKAEISQMDVRIGVIQHVLLSANVREKAAIVHDMHAVAATNEED